MLRFIFVFVFLQLFANYTVQAQSDFRSGYLLMNNGDTLYGELDLRSDLKMSAFCKFKTQNQEIKIYHPGEISGYRFINGKYYITKEFDGKLVFLEYLVKGKLNIYFINDEHGERYFLDKEGVELVEIPYSEGIKQSGDTVYNYTSTKHYGLLSYYLQDATGFQNEIAAIKKPDHKNMINLASAYHKKVCKEEACIIYEKKPSWLEFDPEWVGGLVIYQNIKDLSDYNYDFTGPVIHFSMPRESEKIYFRTGILYSMFETSYRKTALYKFPILIEYIYPKRIIRPKLAYGASFFYPYYHTVAISGGINVLIYKYLYGSFNYDIDFIPNSNLSVIPGKIFSQSASAGLYFQL